MEVRGELQGDALGPLLELSRRRRQGLVEVGKVMERAKDEVFTAEGAPREPWRALSARRVNERKGAAHPILHWSGRLQESYVATDPADGDHEVSIGSDVAYASTHQEGWPGAPEGAVPARPVLIPEQAKDDMIDVFIRTVLDG